ncbi:quinone oxidoreductase [Lactobacillus sp. CBA3606]|uniref:zinc-binding dehydrogenase n=1 Tax=Lactobacillus sp. CBA3606 TaxID=2099789 RepID=UPI000CFD61C4|nr:zinc-binding dehydrogenase [Lactobacillus sp. CBA3606]AVK63699.1 quinone oxidoreductase [Lactobacillus sp. CBA3606]
MKAVVVTQPGGPEVLTYTEVSKPTLKAGWSLLQVKGFGINHSEIFTRQGKSPSVKFPRILGIEAVGVIAETTDATRLPIGQTAISIMGEMGRAFDGSYADYVLVPNAQLYPVTTTLSWAELAAIPETFYTAYGALLGLRLAPQQSLLIRGGTSGVGVSAAKLAHGMQPDLKVVGSSRSLAKKALMLAHGFDEVVIETDGKLATDQRFDRVLDLIGPATVPDSLQHLQSGGIVSSTGQLGGVWTLDQFDPITRIPNGAYLTSFYSGDVDQPRLDALLQVIAQKKIDVRPVKTFKLAEIQAAHTYLASQHSFGKVVVLP